jgi:hypothetical protein
MQDLIIARAERLCLLRDVHKARSGHRSRSAIMSRLRAVTARIAAMEARNG